MTRIAPESPVYQEVARLYQIAQEMRPGGLDRWNGELYSRTDDKYGGLTRDGTFRLNEKLVLDHLTGGDGSGDPIRQGQALATVFHESLHARVAMDARSEPNALRKPQSIGLDEGLTELATNADYEQFAQLAGYDDTATPDPEYPGAVHAAGELLDRATTSEAERADLLTAAIDQPVMMRWDTIAGHIVQNELADTVPSDADHQQAARAHLVNQMGVDEWAVVHELDGLGPTTAELTTEAVDNGVAQIRGHYQNTPDEPYPAKTPNPAAEVAAETGQGEQQRAATQGDRSQADLANFPAPDAATRLHGPQTGFDQISPNGTQSTPPSRPEAGQSSSDPASAGRTKSPQPSTRAAGQQGDPMRFLKDQAPAAHATRTAPSLGDGSRGAGAPSGPSLNRPAASRTPTPDRGGRD
ncbi:hypothetical protein [Kribbella monticola]|uniref:hypothetical protein n=1 Tax=Kribbella monticola TaxID=2185285 RepID=UPI0013005CAD|nr:hypothetical protein [Kribbella monticola]